MSEWFVFSDIEYYPYVVNDYDHTEDRYRPIIADTAEEACGGVGPDTEYYVAPFDQVTRIRGPKREPFTS